jgi:hypothetical protein
MLNGWLGSSTNRSQELWSVLLSPPATLSRQFNVVLDAVIWLTTSQRHTQTLKLAHPRRSFHFKMAKQTHTATGSLAMTVARPCGLAAENTHEQKQRPTP